MAARGSSSSAAAAAAGQLVRYAIEDGRAARLSLADGGGGGRAQPVTPPWWTCWTLRETGVCRGRAASGGRRRRGWPTRWALGTTRSGGNIGRCGSAPSGKKWWSREGEIKLDGCDAERGEGFAHVLPYHKLK